MQIPNGIRSEMALRRQRQLRRLVSKTASGSALFLEIVPRSLALKAQKTFASRRGGKHYNVGKYEWLTGNL